MADVLFNKGRHDNISVISTMATLYHKWTEWGHIESILDDKLTQADAVNKVLQSALVLFAKETN